MIHVGGAGLRRVVANDRAERRIAGTYCALLIFIFAVLCSSAFAEPKFPPLTGRVVDAANLLDANAERQLTAQLAAFEQASGIQLVVATLPDLQGYAIEEYGYQLGRSWGIGQAGRGQRAKDNGVLLIVAKAERRVRIEVGYGLEGTLTDALSANIIHTVILPQFKAGQFAAGIEQGSRAIMQVLRGEYQPRAARAQQPTPGRVLFALMIFVVIMFLRSGIGGGGGFGGSGRRGIFYPGSFPGGGGGGFGGGGFSGGGGSFGGGGASGGW